MGLQSGHDFVAGNVKGAAATAPRHKAQEQVGRCVELALTYWRRRCPIGSQEGRQFVVQALPP